MKKQNPVSILLTFAVTCLAAIPAQATIIINASEVGGDVVFELTGSVDVSSLHYHTISTYASNSYVHPVYVPTIRFTPTVAPSYEKYYLDGFAGPPAFGSGDYSYGTSSGATPIFYFQGNVGSSSTGFIDLPADYVGGELDATTTFSGQTFDSMGITPGTYEWTWSYKGAGDNLVLNIGPSVPANTAPTANAGLDQSIHAGTTVNLDGSLSFDDNTASNALQYAWSFTEQPAGSSAILTDPDTATPSFVADLDGNYVVQLILTDEGALASAPDEVLISSFNQAPTAFATATTMLPLVGAAVSLNGSTSSDPDGDPLTYAWTVTSAPEGSAAEIVNADASLASFTPDLAGDYEVTLTVSDFLGAGTPASVSFVASTAPQFAEEQTIATAAVVAALPSSAVTTAGNQNALQNFLSQAVSQLHHGNVAAAIDKLNQAIARTDGCALRGAPDGSGPGRDWITDCAAQGSVYNDLTAARDALDL